MWQQQVHQGVLQAQICNTPFPFKDPVTEQGYVLQAYKNMLAPTT
jgi:hypothetical protein